MLRRARRKAPARAALAEARARFSECGAALWEARAVAEAGRIGGRGPATSELTPTERRVAELVARGSPNKSVAAALFVTVGTVEAHLSRVYAKLGVRSRAELAHLRTRPGGCRIAQSVGVSRVSPRATGLSVGRANQPEEARDAQAHPRPRGAAGRRGAISLTATASAKAPPVHLTFSKHAVGPGVWSGTVAGDIDGALTTRLLSLDDRKPVWRVTFDWIVDAGPRSFTARLHGTLDTPTGAVAMKGRVLEGPPARARSGSAGSSPATSAFEGTIDVFPTGA